MPTNKPFKTPYLELIDSFAQALLEATSINDVAWTVAKQAIAELGYVDCVIYLFDEKEEYLVQRAAHGAKNPKDYDIQNPIKISLGEGIVGTVAKSKKGTIVHNTSTEPNYLIDDANRLSEIAVPIVANDKVLGIIDSEHPEASFYNDEDFQILSVFAAMTAIKLVQTKTQDELNCHKEVLETTVKKKTNELQSTINKLQNSYEEILNRNFDNEVLLREVHHRVKNNMQIISSLLSMHMGEAANDHETEVFRDCQLRIKSMANVHDQLYIKESLSRIDGKKYVDELCYGLLGTFGLSNRVKIECEIDQISFDIESCIPFGLIVNELVANALKHAFPNNRKGVILVSLINNGDVFKLSVTDNGIGINNREKRDNSFGMELVEMLSEQLEGELIQNKAAEGTSYTLVFSA